MQKQNVIKFLISFVLCQSAGIVGSFFTVNSIEGWYQFLNKPAFGPPNWVFGPAWVLLYTLMAIALYWIWQKGLANRQVKIAFWVFMVHLTLNALWSIIFFGLQNPLLALVDIILLLVSIVTVMVLFYKIKKSAAWILFPYLAWVLFATALNFYIFKLN